METQMSLLLELIGQPQINQGHGTNASEWQAGERSAETRAAFGRHESGD